MHFWILFIRDSDISKSNTPLASPTHLAAILGAVGGALAVVILAAIGIVLVVVVITRRRKAQYTCQDTTRKGTDNHTCSKAVLLEVII